MSALGVSAKRRAQDDLVLNRHSSTGLGMQARLGKRTVADLTALTKPHATLEAVGKDDLDSDDAKRFELYGIVGNGKRFKSRHGKDDQRFQETCGKLRVLGTKLFKKHFDPTAKHNDIEVRLGSQRIVNGDKRKIGHDDLKGKIEEIIKKDAKYGDAGNFQMDFSDGTLRFMQGGAAQEIPKDQLPKDVKDILDFLQLLSEAHDAAMEMIDVREWHTRFDMNGNRPTHGDMPFKLDNPQWEHYRPKTMEGIFESGVIGGSHFDALMVELEKYGIQPQDARARIQRAGLFIEKFGEKLAEKITQKEQAKAAAAAAEKEKIEREIELLKKLKDRLFIEKGGEKEYQIDLLAIATDAALLEDGPITDDQIALLADRAQNVRLAIFKKTRGIDPEKFKGLQIVHGLTGPTQEELNQIAVRTGDLYYHDDLSYLKRFASSHAIRSVRTSHEQFVIHNLMYRRDANYVDDLRSFGLPTQAPEFQKELQDLVAEVRRNPAISN